MNKPNRKFRIPILSDNEYHPCSANGMRGPQQQNTHKQLSNETNTLLRQRREIK